MRAEFSKYDDYMELQQIALAYGNIQEVNVNHVSGYSMISPHSNNKEVMTKENMTPYEICGYNGIISIIIYMTNNISFTQVINYDHSALCKLCL